MKYKHTERCDCITNHPSAWKLFKRCPNKAAIMLTDEKHVGHKMCHVHFLEWQAEAILYGYEELG